MRVNWLNTFHVAGSGHCVVLVWEESSSSQSSIFLDQYFSLFDPEIPSTGFRDLFQREGWNWIKNGRGQAFCSWKQIQIICREESCLALSCLFIVALGAVLLLAQVFFCCCCCWKRTCSYQNLDFYFFLNLVDLNIASLDCCVYSWCLLN